MMILKHVEHEIKDVTELNGLLTHLKITTSEIDGVTLNNIYFTKGKKEFILFLDCESEEKYLEWREICPPPPGANDWYAILLTKEEHFT
jgi:hypothetical protein